MNTLKFRILEYSHWWIIFPLLFITMFFIPQFINAELIGNEFEIAKLQYDQQNPHTIFVSDPNNPSNGLWFVVWEDWRDYNTTGADIYGRFYDSDGNPCGSEFVISNATGNQTVPRAAYRSTESKIVVVWQDTRPNYIKYKGIRITNFSGCSVNITPERDVGFNELEEFDDRSTDSEIIGETIGICDGVRTNFISFLENVPIVPGTINIYRSIAPLFPYLWDDGSGNITGNGSGYIDYNTGYINITLNSPPASGTVYVKYNYFNEFSTRVIDNDGLISRQKPKIAYNKANDEFWVVWKETRSILHRLSEVCFEKSADYLTGWEFGDSDFIGYVRLDGSNTANQKSSLIGINGADIIRNSRTTTLREISHTRNPLSETITYEYFDNVNNPDIACDETSTQCFIVFEGTKRKATLKCNCKDENSNGYCDLADNVTDTLTLECSNTDCNNSQCFTHIFGIFDNQIPMSVIEFKKIDTAEYSSQPLNYYPSVGFDYISKKFLVSWEDMRPEIIRGCIDGNLINENTKKIWGRLVYSSGDLYGLDFMIGYEDLNNDGNIDDHVRFSNQSRPYVSYDPVNQRFLVLWQDNRNSQYSLENIDIYSQKIDSEGSLRGNNFPVITEYHNQYSPTAGYNPASGSFLVVWKDARNAERSDCGSGGNEYCGSDVYGQRFSLGNPVLSLLRMDNTPLSPPLLDNFENPAGRGGVEIGLSDGESFKVKNTGDTVLSIDCIEEDLDCNPGTSPNRTIAPFYIDTLQSQLQACSDGQTIDLMPGAEIILNVSFTPTRGGSYNRCFVIKSNAENPRVNLTAQAFEPDIYVMSPSGMVFPYNYNFGSVNVGFNRDVTFTFSNVGSSKLRISSINGPTHPFSIVSNNCVGVDVTPGASCSVVIRFAPTSGGTFVSEFNVLSNDPDESPLKIDIQGTGVGVQDITVSPLTLNFGGIPVGQFSEMNINIRNDGSANLNITSIVSPVLPFSITTESTCPTTPFILTSGSSCNLTIRFAPTFQSVFTSLVSIKSDDPDEGVIDVSLSGTSLMVPDISVNPSSVVFPDTLVGNTVTQSITVTNNGATNLLISGITSPGGDFGIVSSNCVGTLAPAGTCTITVRFTPTSASFKQTTFNINSNDPDTPSYTVYLSGRGYTEPNISVVPPALNFGTIISGQTSTLNITVSNTGSANLVISSVSSPASPFSITGNTCLFTTIAPGGSCQITVKFAPTTVGTFNSSITIASNDPDTPNVTVNITGTSILTNVDVNPLSINFGDVTVGSSSSPQNVTVRNIGVNDLEITSVRYPGSPFRITNDTCKDKTLIPGETCTISIVFNPTRVAYYNNYYLTINTNDLERPKVRVSLTGRGVNP